MHSAYVRWDGISYEPHKKYINSTIKIQSKLFKAHSRLNLLWIWHTAAVILQQCKTPEYYCMCTEKALKIHFYEVSDLDVFKLVNQCLNNEISRVHHIISQKWQVYSPFFALIYFQQDLIWKKKKQSCSNIT